MKKITLLIAILITTMSFGQVGENATALSSVKGLNSNAEACEAGGKGVVEYPNGWYTVSTPDPLYSGESSSTDWKWNHTVTDLADVFFNGEGKTGAAYGTGDTNVNAIISIDNTTDFTLKAYNKRSALTNSSLTSCMTTPGDPTSGPGNKVVRYSLELTTPFVNPGDVRTVTITITDTNSVTENIVLTATYTPTAGVNDLQRYNFSYAPNPVKDIINLSAAKNINKVELFNLLGQKSKSFEVNTLNKNLDISGLANGIYIMNVTIDETVGSYKIIKQ